MFRRDWPGKLSAGMNGARFGEFGGRYVPEILIEPLAELETEYDAALQDDGFRCDFLQHLESFAGRPTPLYFAESLTRYLGGGKIYLKREDLLHTGAHKINNCLGQALLAKRMGKTRVVADTGAGQHGVATAAVCAMLGLECTVYMGSIDMQRQSLNVDRMRLFGASVQPVEAGSKTLKDAVSETIRDWVTNVETTHCLLGSVVGPHPYPKMVRTFQSIIGIEAREQIMELEGNLPSCLIACVGGGSNAIGLFAAFLEDNNVQMYGVEAAGKGLKTGQHASRFSDPAKGRVGVFQGSKSYVLQDQTGLVLETHSISAGLDYSSVGPEHAMLYASQRIVYDSATDQEAMKAADLLCRMEGILPALESSHAIAACVRRAPKYRSDEAIMINLSGRGDKDLQTILSNKHLMEQTT